MSSENKIIHGLWISGKLSVLERLTIRSFSRFGHEFHLWTYDQSDNFSEEKVIIEDASTIIPADKVFKYSNKIAWGKGSYGGFSDIFRYKLLFEKGGWWVDMDVTCLKPFDFEEPYFFRNHWQFKVVGNVLKCPANSDLMKSCYDRTFAEVSSDNTDWNKPIKILNEEIEKKKLMNFRRIGFFNLDMLHTIKPFLKLNYPFPHDWYGVHWINSAGGLKYKMNSAFELLLREYGLSTSKYFRWW